MLLSEIIEEMDLSDFENIGEISKRVYKGITFMKEYLRNDFIDLELMPKDKYSKEGLFCEVYSHNNDSNYLCSNRTLLMGTCKVEKDGGRTYLGNLYLEYEDDNMWAINLAVNKEIPYYKKTLIGLDGSYLLTDFKKVKEITLNEILREVGIIE